MDGQKCVVDLIVFGVVIVGRRKAAEADIGCSLEVRILHARGDRDLLGVGIIDNINCSAGRHTEGSAGPVLMSWCACVPAGAATMSPLRTGTIFSPNRY